MSSSDGRAYEITEGPNFDATWKDAVRSGLIPQMVAGVVYAEVRDLLRRCPYSVRQFPGIPVDVRRITYGRKFSIWYSICEDDRSVCLEEVTPAYGR